MKDYEAESMESSVSKINSGMLINLRLNDLWKDAHNHARAGQYSKWNDDLDRVWCELGGDEKHNSDADIQYNNLTLAYADSCNGSTKPKGFDKLGDTQKMSITKQKRALIQKEIFLRRLQNKQGKGTAYQDSSGDYMDG